MFDGIQSTVWSRPRIHLGLLCQSLDKPAMIESTLCKSQLSDCAASIKDYLVWRTFIRNLRPHYVEFSARLCKRRWLHRRVQVETKNLLICIIWPMGSLSRKSTRYGLYVTAVNLLYLCPESPPDMAYMWPQWTYCISVQKVHQIWFICDSGELTVFLFKKSTRYGLYVTVVNLYHCPESPPDMAYVWQRWPYCILVSSLTLI